MTTIEQLQEKESELGQYIEHHLGFYDNVHIDDINLKDWIITVTGVFREDSVDDWEQYEADDFPNDIDELTIPLNDFLNAWYETN